MGDRKLIRQIACVPKKTPEQCMPAIAVEPTGRPLTPVEVGQVGLLFDICQCRADYTSRMFTSKGFSTGSATDSASDAATVENCKEASVTVSSPASDGATVPTVPPLMESRALIEPSDAMADSRKVSNPSG